MLGQENFFSATSKVDYDMYLNFNDIQKFKASLFFNDSLAVFNYNNTTIDSEKNNNSFDNISVEISLMNKSNFSVISYKNKNVLFSKETVIGSKNYYYVKEILPKQKWNITTEKKKIGSLECYAATCDFRGRKYTAWYAPDIPTQNGPWKLNGLPGLIIEAYDTYKEVYFTAKKINLSHNQKEKLRNSSLKTLNLIEHLNNQQKASEKLSSKLSARSERGIDISVDIKTTAIELNFDDLHKKKY
jgi:GLPGLI family protein